MKSIKKNFSASQSIAKNLQAFYEKPVLRVSFELFLSIVVVSLFALFALRPTLLTMSKLLKEIEEKQQLDKALQEKIAALATAQSEWAVYQSQFDSLEQSFFQDPSLEEVLLYLEYLARQDDVLVINLSSPQIAVKLNEETDSSDSLLTLTPYETNFQAVGAYQDILNFLDRIEHQQPLMSVESVQITLNQKGDVSPLSVNFLLTLYVQESPGSKSSGSTAAKSRQISNVSGSVTETEEL